MPSGSLTLLEAAKSGSNKLKTGVIQTIIQESPIIKRIPWTPFEGNALEHTVEETLPDVQFRDINETYNRSFGTTSKYFWGVAILGGEIFIDNFLVGVTGSRESLKAKQYALAAKSNAMRFDYEFFNGDGNNKGFKGLKTLIGEGFGQSFQNSGSGATISLDKLDEALDLFRNQGGPAEILLNRTVRRQITKAARTNIVGESMLSYEKDTLGRQVVSWDGIPLTILGDVRDASGNTVPALPFNEDPGDTVSDCCSLYMVKWGEDDVTGLLGKSGHMDIQDFGETEAAPGHLGRLEWYPGVAVFNKYSVVRVTGITAS